MTFEWDLAELFVFHCVLLILYLLSADTVSLFFSFFFFFIELTVFSFFSAAGSRRRPRQTPARGLQQEVQELQQAAQHRRLLQEPEQRQQRRAPREQSHGAQRGGEGGPSSRSSARGGDVLTGQVLLLAGVAFPRGPARGCVISKVPCFYTPPPMDRLEPAAPTRSSWWDWALWFRFHRCSSVGLLEGNGLFPTFTGGRKRRACHCCPRGGVFYNLKGVRSSRGEGGGGPR